MKIVVLLIVAVVLCVAGFLALQALNFLPGGPERTAVATATPGPSLPTIPWPTSRPLPTAQPAPTSTAGPALQATANPSNGSAACVPQASEREEATVVSVVDGDTIDVEIGGRRYPVRYIGIDTPESTRQQEPFGKEAAERNRELVEDRTVVLVKDVSETDRFGRLLRYVFVGDLFVNEALVREGFANAGNYPPDDACGREFFAAEAEAQAAGRGMWAGGATPIPTPLGGRCDPAYPDVCLPPPPPDLNCGEIAQRRFQVLPPDPHGLDPDGDGVGCEG